MKTIKVTELLEEVKRVAKANPDKKVDGCKYFHDNGHPCCIVGTAMFNLGIKQTDLLSVEIPTAWGDNPTNPNTQQIGLVVRCTSFIEQDNLDALNALKKIQCNQDGDYTWGKAVEGAE